ncbi:hypothetical protein V6C31_03455 [Caldibacillus debilis]
MVENIFKIKDKSGNIVNPFKVLISEDKRRSVSRILTFQKNEEEFYRLMRKQKEQSEIKIGMTEEEIIKILGEPININRTITKYGTFEQWVYNHMYLYFKDGILYAIQD